MRRMQLGRSQFGYVAEEGVEKRYPKSSTEGRRFSGVEVVAPSLRAGMRASDAPRASAVADRQPLTLIPAFVAPAFRDSCVPTLCVGKTGSP